MKAVLSQVRSKMHKRYITRSNLNRRIEDKFVYVELWKSKMITTPSQMNRLKLQEKDLSLFPRHEARLYGVLVDQVRDRRKAGIGFESKIKPAMLLDESYTLLKKMEFDLDYEDILYFRTIAEKSFSVEEQKASWASSIFGMVYGNSNSKEAVGSEEEKKNFFEAMKIDPESLYKAHSNAGDVNEVDLVCSVYLKEASITLALSVVSQATFSSGVPFLKFKITDLKQKLVSMGGGSHTRVFLSLQDFEGFELLPSLQRKKKGTEYKANHILHRRILKQQSLDKGSETESNLSISEERSTFSSTRAHSMALRHLAPLISLAVEMYPPGSSEVEVAVHLDVEELEVWITPDPKWINSLIVFGTWPEDQQYWSEAEMKAMNQLADMKARFDAKLAHMMENHASVNIEGRIIAPVLIVHDSRYDHGQGKVDVLIVDLGEIILTTEKLAKVARQRELDSRSQFTMQASGMNSSKLPVVNDDRRDWELLHDTNSAKDTPSLRDLAPVARVLGFEDESMRDFAFDKPGRRSSGLHMPLREQPDDNEPEYADLFDIFHCRVSKVEVYLLELSRSDARMHGHNLWNMTSELEKTVIVPEFEVFTEIQVSVLPWDEEIPPFKLLCSISEVNIMISDMKILRLLSFAQEINESTKKMQQLQEKRREKFPTKNKPQASNKDVIVPMLKKVEKAKSMKLIAVRQRKPRSKSLGGSSAYDESDYKSLRSGYAPSMRESRSIKGVSLKGLALGGDQVSVVESVGMMHDDDDDDSFFSAEGDGNVDPEDNERMIEELKYLIEQRESMRSRLITDIRLNEQDTSKQSMVEALQKELLQCEMNLHQLKVSYVEALVQQSSDDLPLFFVAQADKADQLRNEMDALYTPTKSGTIAVDEGTAAADKKYNFTNAKDIHYEPNDEADVLERAPHKELVHVQLLLQRLNVDFDTALSISQPSSCYRFTVMTIGLKLKHRVENTRITFYLKDIAFSRQPPNASNKMLISNSIPILTSDPTIFATFAVPVNARPYNSSSAPEFVKVRYDISYGQVSNKHTISLQLNYLGINAVVDEILPLVDEALRITNLVQLKFKEKLSPASDGPSLQQQQASNATSKQSPLQNIDLSLVVKVDNIVASIFHGQEPIMSATITSALIRGGFSQGSDAACTIRVVDIALFDLTSSTKKVSYLRTEKYHVPTTNTILSKDSAHSSRLLSVSIRAKDLNADIVQVEMDCFISPVCILIDSHLLVQTAIMTKELIQKVSSLSKRHPFLREEGSSSPTSRSPRPSSLPSQQVQLKSASIEAGGASMHIILSEASEVSLSVGTLNISANNVGPDQGRLSVSLSTIGAIISEEPVLVIDAVKLFLTYRQKSDEEQDSVRLSTNTSPINVFCNARLLMKAQELASHSQKLGKALSAIMSTSPSEKKVWKFLALHEIQPLELPRQLTIDADVNIPLISVLVRHSNGDSLSALELMLFDLNMQGGLNDGTVGLTASVRSLKMQVLIGIEQDQRDASSIIFTENANDIPCLLIEAKLSPLNVAADLKVHGIYVLVIPQDLFSAATLINDIVIAANTSPMKRKSPVKSSKRASGEGLVPSRLFDGEIENQKATPSSIPMKVYDTAKRNEAELEANNNEVIVTKHSVIADTNCLLSWPFATVLLSVAVDSVAILIPIDPEYRRDVDDLLQAKVSIHASINFIRPSSTAFEEVGCSFEVATMNDFGGSVTVDLVTGLPFSRSAVYSNVVMATFTGTASSLPVRGLQTPARKTWSEVLNNGLNPNSLGMDTIIHIQFGGKASIYMKSSEKIADVKTAHDLLAPGWSVNHLDFGFEFGAAADFLLESCDLKCAIDLPLWEIFQLEVVNDINERISALNETRFVATLAPAPTRPAIVQTKADDFASLLSYIVPLLNAEFRLSIPVTKIAVWSGNSSQSFLAAEIQIKGTEVVLTHVPAEKMVPILALRYEVDDETMLPFSDSKESESSITPFAGSNIPNSNSRLMTLSGKMRQLFRGVTSTSAVATAEASSSHQRSILMQTPSIIRVSVKTSIEVAYQNQRLLALEPLVEPMMIDLSIVQNINYQGISCHLIHNRVALIDYIDIDDSLQRYIKALDIDLPPADKSVPAPKLDVSIDKVNVNVTVPFLENVFMLYRAISVADHGLLDRSSGGGSFHGGAGLQVIIRNEAGLPIVFGRGERDSRLLHSGNEINYDMRINDLTISIKRPDGSFWPEITGVSFTGSGSRLYQLSNGTSGKKDSSTTVVLDLSSRDGKKQLTIRSSLRIFNSTKVSMSIQFMDVSRGKFVSPVWEVVLAGGRGVFVPINICSNPAYQLLVLSTERKYELKGRRIDAAGMVPSPEAVGHERTPQNLDSSDTSDSPIDPSQNKEKRRKQLKQRKGVLNMLSYYHWLNLSQHERMPQIPEEDSHERIKVLYRHSFCNLAIESRDAPSRRSMSHADFALLRTIKVLPTVTIVNLLGRDAHVALAPDSIIQPLPQLLDDKFSLKEYIPQYHLRPGEATESLSFHSTETFRMVVKFHGEESIFSLGWSTEVRVTGCIESNQQSSSEMLQAEVDFKNGSSLTISVEVVDRGGCRIINLFTPFWVVGNSFLPIQVQHDPKFHPSVMGKLNGSDDLSADQHFAAIQSTHEKDKTARKVVQSRALQQGIGRARGMNGVLLGPTLPLRGIADAFDANLAASAVISRLHAVQQQENTGYNQRKESGSLKPVPLVKRPSDLTSTYNGSDGTLMTANNGGNNHPSLSFAQNSSNDNAILTIIHSGYSNPARKQCRLKIRNRNTRWTSTIAAEKDGTKDISVNCLYDKSIDDYDGEHSINSPFVKDGHKVLHFGVNTVTLDPPFHRTKAIFVMDRFTVVNLLNQSLEIRQFGEDNVVAIRSGGQEPIWFRTAHNLLCHVRLSKFGWNWSGKFSLNMKGETPIRMMNEFDNTVFFLQIYVHVSGGQVKVIFKGGDRFSPFRFENHSMETFRIHQQGQKQLTNLLPYHYCAYAWDEPLEAHSFILSLQRSNLSSASMSSDAWEKIGMFTFERIEQLKHTSRPYLMLKIVTQGPTRVLQIFDTRMSNQSLTNNNNNRLSLTGINPVDSMVLRLNVMIRAIGISIVDQTPQELLFVSLANVSAETQVAKSSLEVLFGVGRLQIDNQLWSTPFPSLLHPLVPLKDGMNSSFSTTSLSSSERRKQSILIHVKQSFDFDGVYFFPLMRFEIAPFDLNIEMNVIAAAINMVSYAYEEFQETTVISRQQRLILGFGQDSSASTVSQYDIYDSISCTPIALGMLQTKLTRAQILSIYRHFRQLTRNLSSHMHSAYSSEENIAYGSNYHSNSSQHQQQHDILFERTLSIFYLTNILKKAQTISETTTPKSKVYLQHFEISKFRLNISFNPVLQTEINAIGLGLGFGSESHMSLLFGAFSTLVLAIGSSLANIDNCPLRFSALEMKHIFASSSGFADRIVNSYTMEAVKQAYLVLFSSQLLGNPIQLMQTVGEGLWEFVNLPFAKGMDTSPEAFLLGLCQGSLSLLRTVVASLCTTTSHLASSLQVGLLTLGAVDGYGREVDGAASTRTRSLMLLDIQPPAVTTSVGEKDKEQWALTKRPRRRPSGLVDAVQMAALGLILDPWEGYRDYGLSGLVAGSVKGGVGLMARPLYGALDVTISILEQISFQLLPMYLASQKMRLNRMRPPRFFANPNMPMQVYSAEENVGQELLSRVEQGQLRNDGYLWHGHVTTAISSKESNNEAKLLLLLTKQRILLLEERWEFSGVLWQCVLKDILSIEIDYGDSLPLEAQEEMKRDLDSVLQLIQAPSSSSSNNKSTFRSRLHGKPRLIMYYIPQQTSPSTS